MNGGQGLPTRLATQRPSLALVWVTSRRVYVPLFLQFSYFDDRRSFILFFHSLWPTIRLSSRTSTNDESMMSSISTSSLNWSVALFCFRRSVLPLRLIP